MKETDQYKQYQATPRSTLEQEFMSHNTPLREHEHWARNEIESLRKERDELRDQITEVPQLMRSIAACQKDAERYRWLRVQGTGFLEWWADRTPEEGDAAIDAAMKEGIKS